MHFQRMTVKYLRNYQMNAISCASLPRAKYTPSSAISLDNTFIIIRSLTARQALEHDKFSAAFMSREMERLHLDVALK